MALAISGLSTTPQLAPGAIFDAFRQNVDVEGSKRRCMERYKLDASAKHQTICLTASEIAEHREPFAHMLEMIAEEIDYVSVPLSSVSFGASFSNLAGTILYYCSDRSAGHYVDAEREGALWAEGIAGTNGVGTCIVERRPAQIFRNQHFFRDHAHMSCTAVPVLSADAEMFGVLNFSTANPEIRPETFQLVSGLLRQSAERLNNQLFRARYAGQTMLRARSQAGPILLALDGENRLIGANLRARHWLGLAEGPLRPVNLDAMFDFAGGLDDIAAKTGAMLAVRAQGKELSFKIQHGRPARQSLPRASLAPPKPGRGRPTDGPPNLEECLGISPAMTGQAAMLRRIAGSRLPVLLLGETGTGKDTLARALHAEGQRRDKPFVTFNCAAVPETLIDSELFGYHAGAFTGARREGSAGRLLEADGGTLFLDEIGDMPPALQTRLLRVLESGEVSPLGSGKTRIIDVQVIAATNQDLRARMQDRRFRPDLYHRLSGFVVNMMPLRNRTDQRQIIFNVLSRLAPDQDIELSGDALARLQAHAWPGNIRELSHVLQRAIQLCEHGVIRADDLLLHHNVSPEPGEETNSLMPADHARAIRLAAEHSDFIKCVKQNGGDLMKTAQTLNISRATLYRKMKKFQQAQDRKKRPT